MKKFVLLVAVLASASLSSCIYEISPEELEQRAIERGEKPKIDLSDRGELVASHDQQPAQQSQ